MNKKKKIIVIITIILIVLLAMFFCYKMYLLNVYKIDKNKVSEYKQIQASININKNVTIDKKTYDGDYIEYQNIKVANIFNNYKLKEQNNDNFEYGYVSYINEKENGEIIIRKESAVITDSKYESEYNSNSVLSIKCSDKKILEKNNITNDMELIKYFKNFEINSNTILTSKNKICENYYAYDNFTRMALGTVIPFNGNAEGYISMSDNNITINVFDKDEVYILGFNNVKEVNIDVIYDLISSIVME